MSTKFGVKAVRSDFLGVDPNDVIACEEGSGRKYPLSEERVAALAISFAKEGQLQAVECRLDHDRRPVLTFGYTRTAAARLLRQGFDALDAAGDLVRYHKPDFLLKIRVVNCNEAEARKHNILENAQRDNTSDIDDAYNQRWLREDQLMSDADIARFYGWVLTGKPNAARVARLKRLLELDEPTQRLVHDGKLATLGALDLLKVPTEDREPIVGALQSKADVNGEAGKVVAADVRTEVRKRLLKDDDGEPATASKLSKRALKGGKASGKKAAKEQGAIPLSLKEIRKFFADLADSDADGALIKLANDFQAWMSGKKSDDSLRRVLRKAVRG